MLSVEKSAPPLIHRHQVDPLAPANQPGPAKQTTVLIIICHAMLICIMITLIILTILVMIICIMVIPTGWSDHLHDDFVAIGDILSRIIDISQDDASKVKKLTGLQDLRISW